MKYRHETSLRIYGYTIVLERDVETTEQPEYVRARAKYAEDHLIKRLMVNDYMRPLMVAPPVRPKESDQEKEIRRLKEQVEILKIASEEKSEIIRRQASKAKKIPAIRRQLLSTAEELPE